MRQRRGGQTAYQQTNSAAQGAYDTAGNALTSTGNALGDVGTSVVKKTTEAGNWLSGLFKPPAPQAGGSRRRKRSSKGKGFLGMFNIFSRKRQGRSRKGGAAIMGTNSNTNMKPFAGQAVSAPVTKSFSATGGRRRRRGGQTTLHSYPAAGGSRRRRGGQYFVW